MHEAAQTEKGAVVFGYPVTDPERYGVVSFDKNGKVISLEEKPENPRSKYAVPGIYFYDNEVVAIAKALKPSTRGELEITDLNRCYLEKGELQVKLFGRGFAWFDTGTHSSLLDASNYVETIQKRQGTMVSCPEEIAWRMGYITDNELEVESRHYTKSEYGKYLISLLEKNEG